MGAVETGLTSKYIHALAIDKNGYIFAGTRHGVFRSSQSTTGMIDDIKLTISSAVLEQNYPNPFNPITTINFFITTPGFISLKIYNILGKEISILISRQLNQGNHSIKWNASSFASGVYFYKLQGSDFCQIKKLVLLR